MNQRKEFNFKINIRSIVLSDSKHGFVSWNSSFCFCVGRKLSFCFWGTRIFSLFIASHECTFTCVFV